MKTCVFLSSLIGALFVSVSGQAEIEERIQRIKQHQGVIRLLFVDKDGVPPGTSEGINNKISAAHITDLAQKARSVIRVLDPRNDLTFLRIRAKGNENMVAPDNDLFFINVDASE